ncbi:hypothetical protein, partial [Nocardia abscessus]|uniref:hypothetical protein n=1 Tax=Nocardia abscessus TaxID=120957 RepID=UPI0024540725
MPTIREGVQPSGGDQLGDALGSRRRRRRGVGGDAAEGQRGGSGGLVLNPHTGGHAADRQAP